MAIHPPLHLALFEPDIPQNTAAVLRTCACLGVAAEIIGPAGFVLGGAKARRAGMDYLDQVQLTEHDDWAVFQNAYVGQRRVLLTTQSAQPYTNWNFQSGDILVCGRESAGVPAHIHDDVDARVVIPMASGARSLNLAASASMVLGEALRQLKAFPARQYEQ
jgi:tRNA (cytidine/uridine-2'-O-)-methyltransferase